jgi:DNA modification methylase
MRYIHPFPARMAPEIALAKIESLSEGQNVLDPMSGSGMVLAQAARSGLKSIGYDLDPLASLISRAGATRVKESSARETLSKLIHKCQASDTKKRSPRLAWIDDDEETSTFVDYWFYDTQRAQLRTLAYHLVVNPITTNKKVLDILKISLSRLIVTKEPKASLARDTAHSRPHRTILSNEFNIYESLPASLEHVLKSLEADSILVNTKTYLGDARRMTRISSNSIDAIITSPPYLNALDYMRGHRLALVWFGYSLSRLRGIRGSSIGAEKRVFLDKADRQFAALVRKLDLEELDDRPKGMLNRYFQDLVLQCAESFRVLKPGSAATYVIGNSSISGQHIQNSELLKKAGISAGFTLDDESIRKIPDNRRYLPITVKSGNALASRMRTEHIIEFRKKQKQRR